GSLFVYFFFYCYGDHRDLHSFPTRRSSDLSLAATQGQRRAGLEAGAWDYLSIVLSPEELTLKLDAMARLKLDLERALEHGSVNRSEEHTSELQSRRDLVCRLLLEKKKKKET